MLKLILSRTGFSIFSLLVVGLVLFMLTRSIAGSPALIVLGADATEDQVRQFNIDHGLNQPVLVQYLRWLGDLISGDLGRSFVTGRSVSSDILGSLPLTVEIVLVAFAFALVVSIPLGIASALAKDRGLDQASRIFSVIGVSIPGFWLGLQLIRIFAVDFEWFPPGGISPASQGMGEHFQSLVLPSFALGVYYIAVISRMMRSSLLDVLGSDYVRTARAMGLSRSRVLFYAAKNAIPAVISISAMSFGYMFGWALIIEQVFNIPGMSRALLTAITQRDYVLVQAIVYVFTIIFIASNLVADIMNAYVNPRI